MAAPPRLTDLPLPRALFGLVWPALTSIILVNVFNLVDAYWVGRLGTDALGGMSASAFLVWCLHSAGHLVAVGVTAVVARRVGEERPEEAGRAAAHGLLLALLLALAVMGPGYPTQDVVLRWMGLSPGVHRAALDYLTPILLGFPAITGWFTVDAIFRASGDTRTPMVILSAALTLNMILDPMLIFGWGPLPAMGIAGAAWATVIAHALGVAVGLRVLGRRPVAPRRLQPVDPALLRSVARIGAPIAATSLLFSVVYVLLTPIIARHGDAPVAAMGLGHRVEGLAFFTCLAFNNATATLVGQHLGAGHPARAERAAWLSAGITAGIIALLSVAFFAFAPWIFALFSEDPAVVAEGTAYLRIIALFEVGMALELVLEGAFSGAGDSVPAMAIGVPLTALRVPAAHLLERYTGLGVQGVWWTISVSTALKGALSAFWFRLGRWKRATV